MINWLSTPKGRPLLKLDEGTIKLGNTGMTFTKEALLKVIKRFSKSKGVIIGIENNVMFLKDDVNGYKLRKASNYYVISLGYKVVENLIINGIKLGIYELEEVDESVVKCNLIEEF